MLERAIPKLKKIVHSKGSDFSPSNGGSVIRAENWSLGLLEQAIKEFKEKPHTQEVVTQYWQALWKVWGEKAGLSIAIPSCDRTAGEIKQLEKKGRKLVYVPHEVASNGNRFLLGKIFPMKKSYAVDEREDNRVINESNQGGWFDIEASLDSPNRNTTEKDLEDRFKKQGKVGQRLNTYIVGSQDAKLQTGHYFDERIWRWSRLLGCRFLGDVVTASFDVHGRLTVIEGTPRDFDPKNYGGRSEGSKKT